MMSGIQVHDSNRAGADLSELALSVLPRLPILGKKFSEWLPTFIG